MTKNSDFCALIKYLRERKGISGRYLSIKAGLSPSYVSKVENGVVLPTIESFAKIISHLDVTDKEVAYLIFTLLPKE